MAKKKIVGFACGSFDLMHAGHVLMFKECKEHCDYLLVGVQSDPTIDRPNKDKPIMTHDERIELVKSVKYVDNIITYDSERDLMSLLTTLRPDVRFLDESWKTQPFTGISLPVRIRFTARDSKYCTDTLRKKIAMEEARKYNSSFYLTLLSELDTD